MEKIKTSWSKLKSDKPLLSVGIIESCFKISLVLFLFIWTPLLEETIGGFIHPGAIFACFMLARLIGSELFEGLSGIFAPLMSSLKSQMIPERHRTTIMSFFRIPINILSIVSLIGTRFLTTYQICLICFVFMAIATIINLYLFKVHTPPDAEKREIKKTSEFLPRVIIPQKQYN